MLRTGVQTRCQRLLSVRIEAWGGVLDARQRLVDLEHVGDVRGALYLQTVGAEAAKEGKIGASAAADTFVSVTRAERGDCGVLERLQRGIRLEGLSELLDTRIVRMKIKGFDN